MTVGTPSDLRQGGRFSQSRMDDAVRRLGRFQIIGRLATGGMAEVYLALSGELPGFRTLIVVKRILPHLASNRQFIRMFLDEARLAALLDHPNVVRIIEVGHDNEEYFLAMELVQGKPLSAVLRKAARERRPPSPALAAYIIAQAASGLGYAHALTDGDGRPLGVVHRDVSPQNILLSFEGAVKLIDFGVARAFGRVAHTSPGGLKGKIEYMSPEQASAEEVDHRADVFALGVVLWEVLTGRRLFRRETELATMRSILDDPIPRPSEVADVPAALDAVVMRALRKRRDARFGSAHEMAQALEHFAFSNEGFSPLEVASYMKGLFAPEFLQWRKTATAALDMEVERDDRHPRLDAPGAEPLTQGPTMALRPGLATAELAAPASEVRLATASSRGTHAPETRSQTLPSSAPSSASKAEPPTKRDRLVVYGGLTLLAALTGYGASMLARPQPAGDHVRAAAGYHHAAERPPLAAEPPSPSPPAPAPAPPVAVGPEPAPVAVTKPAAELTPAPAPTSSLKPARPHPKRHRGAKAGSDEGATSGTAEKKLDPFE